MFVFAANADVPSTGLEWVIYGVLGFVAVVLSWRLYVHLQTLRSKDETSAANAADTTRPAKGHSYASDSAYLRALLLENDGQMRQKKLVDETEWSKAKVSLLLSEMETNDQLSKIRLGRENLVVMAGFEPEITRSSNKEKDRDSNY